jgi:hypothetical protein
MVTHVLIVGAGQRAMPFDPDVPDHLDLLESVKARPPVYRPTP